MTEEHVIPQQVGGKLSAYFLCKPCNDRLGSDVEARVKHDPSIRLAIEELRAQMPKLARAVSDGMPYVGPAPESVGDVCGIVKQGRFKVSAGRGRDGSRIQDTAEARQSIERAMRKKSVDAAMLAEVMSRFDSAPMDTKVALTDGISIIKRSGKSSDLTPALDGPQLDTRVLLKIAYECLALRLGDHIYEDRVALADLRAAVLDGRERPDVSEVEYLTSREYSPVHGLTIVGLPHFTVGVCLFDWLRYRVHFKGVAVAPPNFVYECRLDTGCEDCAVLPEGDDGPPAGASDAT